MGAEWEYFKNDGVGWDEIKSAYMTIMFPFQIMQ